MYLNGKAKEQSEELSYHYFYERLSEGCVGVWGGCGVGVCIGSVWGVGGRVGGGGRGGEKVSLAALLSGYLGKSGHLPRFN